MEFEDLKVEVPLDEEDEARLHDVPVSSFNVHNRCVRKKVYLLDSSGWLG